MEDTFRTSAIVLASQAFREYDSRKTVYSLEKGKLDLVARGVKKIKSKLSAHLEPLSLSEIMVVRGRQFDYVGAAVSRNCYAGIKRDLASLQIAGQAVSAFQKLVSQAEGDKIVFFLLKDFLDFLDREIGHPTGKDSEILASFFILKLLALSGYEPEMFNCLHCGNKISPSGNYFDFSHGGLLCQNCYQPDKNIFSISDSCIKVLREILEKDFDDLKKIKLDEKLAEEINNVINFFYQYCV